ncbi:MAG TPA: guanylate kinase [Bacteroidales bacterium]|nr:guanylate kinase [Bacteroidales bacterium]
MYRKKGKLLIFSAPSGSGKTTIVRRLLDNPALNLEFSISACSRPLRKDEVHGRDYYFLSQETFLEKIKNGEFVEWEEVYKDHFYGTLRSEVERIRNKGNHVIFDIDVQGGLNLKKTYGQEALAIFVMPPSVEELERRLNNRSTDDPQKIKLRISKAESELKYARLFDRIIYNTDLEKAVKEAEEMVVDFIRS